MAKLTISGTESSSRMVGVLRTTPGENQNPWLIRQWGPNTADPVSGEYWRDTPANATQLKKARQLLMREYPLCAKLDLDCCAYAARRAGPGVLALLNITGMMRNAFDNWKEQTEIRREQSAIPDNYTENKLQTSYRPKYLVNDAIRNTIQKKSSIHFEWGHIAMTSSEIEESFAKAKAASIDVALESRSSDFAKLGLVIDLEVDQFLATPSKANLPRSPGPGEGDKDSEDKESPDWDSDDSTDSNPDVEAHTLEEVCRYETTMMAAGKSKGSFIHVVHDEDDGIDKRIKTICGSSPMRPSGELGFAFELRSHDRSFCGRCLSRWPRDMINRIIQRTQKISVTTSIIHARYAHSPHTIPRHSSSSKH